MKTSARLALFAALIAAPAMAQGNSGNSSQGSSAGSLSPADPVSMPQPVGPFPTNAVTNRPFVAPDSGRDGLRTTIGALENGLIGLKQLGMQVKEAHWNVSGTLFYPLHIQLQEQYEGIEKLTDRVAERLLAVGASADARPTTIVKAGLLPEIPGGFIDDAQVISWFIAAYKQVAEQTKVGISDTEKVDPTSSNLLQEVEDKLSHYQWMMRAYVQATPTDANASGALNDGKPLPVPAQSPPANADGK